VLPIAAFDRPGGQSVQRLSSRPANNSVFASSCAACSAFIASRRGSSHPRRGRPRKQRRPAGWSHMPAVRQDRRRRGEDAGARREPAYGRLMSPGPPAPGSPRPWPTG
jgi:hypothetical protein